MLMPALLLALALLLFLQVSRDHSSGSGKELSSVRAAEPTHGIPGEPVESGPRKPSKVSERPEPPKHGKADGEIPLAEPVPGLPGLVYHPVSGKIVDVKGIPAGLMVRQGFGEVFRVPKMSYIITAEAYRKAVWNITAMEAGGKLFEGSESGLMLFPGNSDGVSVVSCHPLHWETQWDDGTPYVPEDKTKEQPDSSLE